MEGCNAPIGAWPIHASNGSFRLKTAEGPLLYEGLTASITGCSDATLRPAALPEGCPCTSSHIYYGQWGEAIARATAADDSCVIGRLHALADACTAKALRSGLRSAAAYLAALEARLLTAWLGHAGQEQLWRATQQLQHALAGFRRGGKASILPPDVSRSSCGRRAADARFLQLAQEGQKQGHPSRTLCLFPAAWPKEQQRVEVVGRTFARHCSGSIFFVAANPEVERRKMWHLMDVHGGHRVVNVLAHFGTQVIGPDHDTGVEATDERSRQLLAIRGNLISKILLMFLLVEEQFLEEADAFCRVDLDSAFVADNLRAFLRAFRVMPEDNYYIGLQSYWLKYRFGVYADGGAGVCLTRAAVEALAAFIRAEGAPEHGLVEPQPGLCRLQPGFNDDVVLAQCMRGANVSEHPQIEDHLGRAYASRVPLPCRQHLGSTADSWPAGASGGRSRKNVLAAMSLKAARKMSRSQASAWLPQLHRFTACEPRELALMGSDYWLSPFAFGFHGYKDLSLQEQAFGVIYRGDPCNWTHGYQLRVVAEN